MTINNDCSKEPQPSCCLDCRSGCAAGTTAGVAPSATSGAKRSAPCRISGCVPAWVCESGAWSRGGGETSLIQFLPQQSAAAQDVQAPGGRLVVPRSSCCGLQLELRDAESRLRCASAAAPQR